MVFKGGCRPALATALAISCVSPSVAAQSNVPEETASPSGGRATAWSSVEGEASCGASRLFADDGNTKLSIHLFVDGTVGVSVLNRLWDTASGKRYRLALVLGDHRYTSTALGIDEFLHRGFTMPVPSDESDAFVADLAATQDIGIMLGDTLLEEVSLEGLHELLPELRECAQDKRNSLVKGYSGERGWRNLPNVPFDDTGPLQSESLQPNRPPAPLAVMRMAALVSGNYPPLALREGRQGTVRMLVMVKANGTARKCRIRRSSGHADLDAAACRVMLQYGRFTPATDDEGKPTEGKARMSITYTY